MIRREKVKGEPNQVKVMFVLPEETVSGPVSVVGDFNDWRPGSVRLVRRSNRTYSNSVVLPRGRRFRFRYLADGGAWLNEEQADDQVPNEYGTVDSVLET